ncbi:class I SAM-dependent methyltransferase [Nocardia sp. CNY236]|uniref:class I SAM-dependent methyltransferase n=1 Tax=Nocardia sp. CNY236 TaxID=1169152 RepID=UPI001E302466|nr:class I SAM-dependent methyltransferase [Nocardia sp. CNY236]
MAETLRPVFGSEEEIATRLGVAARHRWLLHRWLGVLRENGWLIGEGKESRLEAAADPARADLTQVCADLGYRPELAHFFDQANRHAGRLLADRILPQELLFPDGDFLTADAAYRDNLINRYLNTAARELVAWAVDRCHDRKPVRILELGAGIGGTTTDVLPALESSPVDYHFTDVSRFFLDAARNQFAALPWMRYGIIDLNNDLAAQPDYDIILAANVLHNAHHIGTSLRQLHRMLRPGGVLIFLESCREHYQSLTSMHFLMSPRPGAPLPGTTDVRAGTRRIFAHEHEWLEQLTHAGFELVAVLPESWYPLHVLGQRVFASVRV